MIETTKPPISLEFSEVLREIKLGTPIDKALLNLTLRVKSKDLKMAVTSINLARETGGNMGEILIKIANTMRERKKLRGKVEAMTSQGKMSGLVMAFMPFIMLALLYLIEPKIFGLMFSTTPGNIMLIFIVIMVLIGMQFIKKIVDVKV
ncbi:type II secretion system F family protein [bacterium]